MSDAVDHKAVETATITNAVLQEIPSDLIRLIGYVIRAFYGAEYYLVVHYVYMGTCVKEEEVRAKTSFDQRFLRRILAQLKMDKILKERIDADGNDGRCHKTTYYYINYRGVINVVKYRFELMKHRLEVKESETVFKATYSCTGCACAYGALDMDRIFNTGMGEMRCYRCRQPVQPDESSISADRSRSLLARFNEQMLPLFSMIQELDGICLARHLLEPPARIADQQDALEEAATLAAAAEAAGLRTFAGSTQITHSEMQRTSNITVYMGNSSPSIQDDNKSAIPWLMGSDDQPDEEVAVGGNDVHSKIANSEGIETDLSTMESSETDIEDLLLEELDEDASFEEELDVKRADVGWHLNLEESYDDGKNTVTVQGISYPMSKLTPKLVLQMSPAERAEYTRIVRENIEF